MVGVVARLLMLLLMMVEIPEMVWESVKESEWLI